VTAPADKSVPHEREAKVSVWPGFRLPDLHASVPWVVTTDPTEQVLDARYIDAEDLRLLRMGITFRHRTGEGDPKGRWTLKLPAASEGLLLDRLELEEPGPPGPPPEHLAALVKGVMRGAALVQVAHLQTHRTVVPITDQAERPLGLLSDDVVSAFDGDRVGLRFREIEVEAEAGAPDAMVTSVVDVLRKAGAGEPDQVPKLARALGPRAMAPCDPDVGPVGKDATTLAVFQSAVASSVRRLLLHDPVVRLDAGDEGVHQARVATRRLRSDLRTFRPLLDEPDEPPALAPLLDELRWLGGLLGAVRDADVLGQRLGELVRELDDPDEEAAQGLRDRLAAERAPMLDELHEAFNSDRYVRLVQALVELALDPPPLKRADTPARTTMPELAEKPWDHLVRRVDKLGQDPADEELHRVRILAKRARYAAEAAAVVVPAADRHASAIADVQSVLGDHQDAVVAEAWLRRAAAGGATGPEAFAAGLLVTMEREQAARYRKQWRSVWKDASRKKLASWLPG
jgi:CHAD domain-containing protein